MMLNKLKGNDDNSKPSVSAPAHYNGDSGFKYMEEFPNCGNPSIHIYVLFALKHLLRLGKKNDVRSELKKAITYLARAYYIADKSNYESDDISVSFKDWN